jgi:hypothetical protein
VCGASRHVEPEALARLVGWSTTLEALAPRLRCSHCGKKPAEVVAVAKPSHIKKLDDCFGQFLVRASCPCGAVREIEPEALARLVGWQ